MRRTNQSLIQELEAVIAKADGTPSAPDYYALQEIVQELKVQAQTAKYPTMDLFGEYEEAMEFIHEEIEGETD